MFEDAQSSVEINTENEDVIKVEKRLMQVSMGDGNEGTKERRGIGGVCQPIVFEKTQAALCQAVQEILVLVGVVQPRLGVDDAEQQRPAHSASKGCTKRETSAANR